MIDPREDPARLARLAALQAALLDLLASDVALEGIVERLRPLADDAATRAWLDSFAPEMVATARELVRRWGRR